MDEAIRRKLLADAEGTGDDRRLALLAKMFGTWANDDHDTTASDTTFRKLLQIVGQTESSAQKTLLANQTSARESEYYAKLSQRIAADTGVAHQHIAQCRKALQDAKQIRKHRQEYGAMATLIKQHRSRKDSQKMLENLNQELKTAVDKRDQCLEQLDQRRKQLHVLFVSLRELSDLMKNSETSK